MRRRSLPIHGYLGENGGGKSATGVTDLIPSIEAGRPVRSTVRLLDYDKPRPCELTSDACGWLEHDQDGGHGQAHPLWTAVRTWDDVMTADHCELFIDEITGVFSARETHALPFDIGNMTQQFRRRKVRFGWSGVSWGRADIQIRSITQAVSIARGCLRTRKGLEPGDPWARARWSRVITYDTRNMPEWTDGKRKGGKPLARQWLRIGKAVAFSAYDTEHSVSFIETVSDAGRCVKCSGRRTTPPCSCPDYVQRVARAKARAAA
jgi:hypothetical protein